MTVTLDLPPDLGERVKERAAEQGQDPEAYIAALVEKDAARPPTFAEIFAPFRREVEESGVSDAELDALFEEALREARQEKRTGQPA